MSSAQITSSTFVAAPPSVVFAIVADPRQHARIDGSGTVRSSVSGPDTLVLGSEFGMDMKMGAPYKIKNRVVEFEQDRLIAWRHVGAHRWRYELEPTTVDGVSGTEVTETWDLSHYPKPYALVVRTLFAKKTQVAIDETMTKLKAASEADAATPAG